MPPPPPNPSQSPNSHSNTFLNTVLNPNTNTHYPASTPPRPTRPFEQQQPQFSATQRSLQARNKGYNIVGAGRKESEAESYEARQKREAAARILESMEMLIWYSGARNESIPQTRQHYQNIVLGIEEDESEIVWKEEWEVEDRDRRVASPRSAKGKERDRDVGRRRVSSGKYA